MAGSVMVLLGASACGAPHDTAGPTAQAAAPRHSASVPHYSHVVVVMEENHGYGQIIGNPAAPFENAIARSGVNFTDAHAEYHPSQPNYLEFFSGSTHGVSDDHCITNRLHDPSLGGQLRAAGTTFTGYADGLPKPGSLICESGDYRRYHNVPLAFSDVPASSVVPFSQFPRGRYAQLPAVSWVTPNYAHDMHNGTVAAGDAWLRANLGGYARWATDHNSLLIVVFDEDDDSGGTNHIPAILSGAHLKTGGNTSSITHDTLLALIEDSFGLPRLGNAIDQVVPPVFSAGR
ncbi:MAG: alkaline phosphatase family protein [Sciscionella sp.]